jgi:leader peptidase (prepilin peptidase)/N-methyltransferase
MIFTTAAAVDFLYYMIGVFIGLCLGSFATALLYRLPRRIPWHGKARSACPSCGVRLIWKDLVPVLSWLWLRGRCRACGSKIPASYPLIELGVAAAVLALFYIARNDWKPLFFPLFTFF